MPLLPLVSVALGLGAAACAVIFIRRTHAVLACCLAGLLFLIASHDALTSIVVPDAAARTGRYFLPADAVLACLVVAALARLGRSYRRAGHELRAARERYEMATAAGRVGVWDWNPNTNEIFVDAHLKAFLGYRDDEIPNHLDQWGALVHPDDQPAVQAAAEAHFSGREPRFEVLHRMLHRDGSTRWVSARGRAMFGADGKPYRVVGTDTDVTELVRTQEALRHREREFATLADHAPDSITRLDSQCRFLYVNEFVAQVTGRPRESFIGRSMAELGFPAELSAEIEDAVRYVFRSGAPRQINFTFDSPHGRRFFEAFLVPEREASGRPASVLKVSRDVTHRHQAEDALRKAHDELERRVRERTAELVASEARYRLLADHATDMISKHDEEGRFTYVSPACRALLGLPPADLTGRPLTEFVHEADRDRVSTYLDQVRRTEDGIAVEFRVRRSDGRETWLEMLSKPVPSGAASREAISVSRDVSARRLAEEEARRRESELTSVARLATLGEMMAQISHEINQPLTAIANYAEAARQQLALATDDTNPVRDDLRDITDQAHRAGEIIRRIRLMAKRRDHQKTATDVNELVRDALKMLEPRMRFVVADVQCRLNGDVPTVSADAIQIEQVLLNLLNNAVAAVQAVTGRDRQIVVQTELNAARQIEVTVSDNGPGIVPEAKARIFETFFTTKPNGLGLGLAISRSIIEVHGGQLWVEDRAGGGAAFRFILPTHEAACAAPAAAPRKLFAARGVSDPFVV